MVARDVKCDIVLPEKATLAPCRWCSWKALTRLDCMFLFQLDALRRRWPVLNRYCCPRPSVIRIQMEAVGLFFEVRMKNDVVIKGKFCVLTNVLTFYNNVTGTCSSCLSQKAYPISRLLSKMLLFGSDARFLRLGEIHVATLSV